MRSLILTTAIVSSLVIAGCGSDDDDASAATVDAPATTPAAATDSDLDTYCGEVKAAFDGVGDPGFDQFFADHPEPTLEDWAAFLPGPIALLTPALEDIEALNPPAEVADQHAAVVEATTAVVDSFQVSLDAAESGDKAAFDANGQAPGDEMDAATAELGAACGFED